MRLIPTGAGNTLLPDGSPWVEPAHPHRRGEHLWRGGHPEHAGGSSPQARGTLDAEYDLDQWLRLIPTGAGNTQPDDLRLHRCAAHPHRRGEHCLPKPTNGKGGGSSPQARGTHRDDPRRTGHRRLIPTGAGNTNPGGICWNSPPAHPHRRGEHSLTSKVGSELYGSSPQARGTPGCRQRRSCCHRLIPTGAGNTAGRIAGNCGHAAHPHRRGEHYKATTNANPERGSSPQARGTRRDARQVARDHRLIPTGAGNTSVRIAHASASAAHPHRRGEHGGRQACMGAVGGSSPQARGTPCPAPWSP